MRDLDKDRIAYRETVTGYLIMNHNWDGKKCADWIDRNYDYMEVMWSNSCLPETAANLINEIKEDT